MDRRRTIRPRSVCPACFRPVAVDRAGNYYRHYGHDGTVCSRSGEHAHRVTGAIKAKAAEPENTLAPTTPTEELAQWWRKLAEAEIDEVVAKAVEYGATDLRDLGWQILEMGGHSRHNGHYDDEAATEVGIAFYAAGKVARIVAAVKEGRRPSVDSWHDLGVYARMAQRVREAGAWPGGPAGRSDSHRSIRVALTMADLPRAQFGPRLRDYLPKE